MDADQLAQAIRATLRYCQGDRYTEVRAVLGMLAEHIEAIGSEHENRTEGTH